MKLLFSAFTLMMALMISLAAMPANAGQEYLPVYCTGHQEIVDDLAADEYREVSTLVGGMGPEGNIGTLHVFMTEDASTWSIVAEYELQSCLILTGIDIALTGTPHPEPTEGSDA